MIKILVLKRVKAFLVDYLIILGYIILLFGATLLISTLFSLSLESVGPIAGQIIGFTTLTLPVVLYFTLSEHADHAGTRGKKKYGLQVVSVDLSKATLGQLLLRNCLKFLPWELAHFFVFRLFDFTRNNSTPPDWVLTGLIASQVLALIYLLFLFLPGSRSIYEILSSTKVVEK